MATRDFLKLRLAELRRFRVKYGAEMRHISKIKSKTTNSSTFSQIIKGVTILTLVISFLLSPDIPVSAQISAEEVQNLTFISYLPITMGGEAAYYVSPEGDDNNPGSFRLPWRTISKVTDMVEPGDTVYIRSGVYLESVDFTTSGTSNAPIRILAYPGETPVIDGDNFNIPGEWGVLLGISGDYIQVSGFEVRYSRGLGVIIRGSHDIADKIYSHHNRENGILISRGHNSIVENSLVWRNALSNEYGQGDIWASGLTAARSGVSYATIRHNTVWENWGEGISSYEADHIVIEDNITHDNFTANIYLSDSTNVLCQRNFVYTNPASYMFPYGGNNGIMMGDEVYNPPSANITVINNISFGNHVNFWWWQGVQGGGMNNVLIANNTFVNGIGDPNHGEGNVIISGGDHQNVRFENNLVQQDGEFPVIATIANPGVTYTHNLWSKTPYPAASGPGDIIGNPLLKHVGNPYVPKWFQLTSVSPAIDAAIALPEVYVDYFGIGREAPPDMGANEFFPTP